MSDNQTTTPRDAEFDISDDQVHELHLAMLETSDYPVYPSAKITIPDSDYMDAVSVLKGVPHIFYNGHDILVPEYDTMTIDLIKSKYETKIEYGFCKEYEFATLAINARLPARLISLGTAVIGATGQSADEMLRAALLAPEQALKEWASLYRARMDVH